MGAFVVAALILGATSTSTASPLAEVGAQPPGAEWPVDRDWVRFVSGEWLNEECLGLRRNMLTFNSDQTGEAEWDFDDVTDLLISQTAVFVFTDRTSAQGRGRVTPDRVLVETLEGVVSRPRSELLRIVMGDDREIHRWELRLKAGTDISAGNSRQVAFNGEVRTIRRGDFTRLELQYVGSVGYAQVLVQGTDELDWQTTVNNHRGNGAYEWYFSPRFFWRALGGYVAYDELQGILVKTQPGTLIGWQPVDGDRLTLDVGLGAGYQHTTFIEDIDSINTGGVVGTVDADWSPPGPVDIEASVSAFADLAWDNPANQSTLYNRLDFDIDITSIFDLSLTFIHAFVADPQGINPTTGRPVQSNDFQFILGISATFD